MPGQARYSPFPNPLNRQTPLRNPNPPGSQSPSITPNSSARPPGPSSSDPPASTEPLQEHERQSPRRDPSRSRFSPSIPPSSSSSPLHGS